MKLKKRKSTMVSNNYTKQERKKNSSELPSVQKENLNSDSDFFRFPITTLT